MALWDIFGSGRNKAMIQKLQQENQKLLLDGEKQKEFQRTWKLTDTGFNANRFWYDFNKGGWTPSPLNGSDDVIKQGYHGSTAIFSIIDTVATKFASIPRFVYQKDKGTKTKGKYTELEDFLDRPNENQSWESFLYELISWRLLTGNAYVYLNRGNVAGLSDEKIKRIRPVEMNILPSNRVRPIQDPNHMWNILGYEVTNYKGEKFRLSKYQVLHTKNLSMLSHIEGFSPLTSGTLSHEIHQQASKSLARGLANDGANGFISMKPDPNAAPLSPEQEDDIADVINSTINGNDNKSNIPFLGEATYDFVQIGKSATELQTIAAKKDGFMELCHLWGVPPELFSTDSVSWANKSASQVQWVSNRIIVYCKTIDSEFNRMLLPAFNMEKVAFIASDPSTLPEFQTHLLSLSTAMAQNQHISLNEKRLAMGYERIEDPLLDEVFIEGIPLSEWKARNSMNEINNELLNRGALPSNTPPNGEQD